MSDIGDHLDVKDVADVRVVQSSNRPALFGALALALLLGWALTGCAGFRARVQTATASAVAPADPVTPAKVDEAALPVPAGSKVEIRRETSTPAPTPAEPTPAARTVETVTVTPSADTRLTLAHAESGTQRAPDVRTELRKIDNAARAPLLYAALGAFTLAVAGVYFRYPTPAALCALAGAGFLAAWKIADLPAWLWTVAAAAVVAAVALYIGHERGEKLSAALGAGKLPGGQSVQQ